jgi:hypothetical protein
VIGVDGTRFDALGPEATPSLWALGVAPVIIDEGTYTWSGPCWATIATGVPMAEHNVLYNDLTGHRLAEHPDFLTLATRAGLSTLLAVSGWPPLALPADGGPMFAEVSRREFAAVDKEHDLAQWETADEQIASTAAAIIADEGPRVSFVYLGAVDIAGHETGVGPVYHAAARAADRRAGQLISAVRSRPAGEDWTIVAVTDHGHLDGGGHGGREPEVVTAWAAVAGPGIDPAGPPPVRSQLDVAPLVLAAAALAPGAS